MSPPSSQKPTATLLFLVFTQVTLTSFGGGLSGWMYREFVQSRRWISEEEFLNGLSLSQALPGFNVTNLAIWVGYRLLGARGAFAAASGMVLPSAILVVVLAYGLSSLAHHPATQLALQGAAAAAIGLSLSMGLTSAWRLPRHLAPFAVMVVTFLCIGIFRLPLIWVLLACGSVSVAIAYFRSP